MAELETIYSYMREFSTQLGERILEEYPALQSFEDPVSPRIDTLLRRPFPAQNIAIMSVAKKWEQFRTALIVAGCGTGKTLISLSAIHAHRQGRPYTALAMVPPHLVGKWAREALIAVPGLRVFLIDDMRNGGDEKAPHGINEVRLRRGEIVREGLRTLGFLGADIYLLATVGSWRDTLPDNEVLEKLRSWNRGESLRPEVSFVR